MRMSGAAPEMGEMGCLQHAAEVPSEIKKSGHYQIRVRITVRTLGGVQHCGAFTSKNNTKVFPARFQTQGVNSTLDSKKSFKIREVFQRFKDSKYPAFCLPTTSCSGLLLDLSNACVGV